MAPNTSRCRCEQTTSRIPKTSREPIGCQRSSRERPSIANRRCTRLHCSLHRYYHRRPRRITRTDDYSARVSQRRSLSIRYSSGATRCSVGRSLTQQQRLDCFSKEDSGQSEFSYSHFSVAVGVVGAVAVSGDFAYAARERLQRRFDVNSHPHQPWVGSLKTANIVRVLTTESWFQGYIAEWSESGNERQIALGYPAEWDGDGWSKMGLTKKILL